MHTFGHPCRIDILSDIAKLSHLYVGKEIRLEKVSIKTAENLFNAKEKYLAKIFQSIKSY